MTLWRPAAIAAFLLLGGPARAHDDAHSLPRPTGVTTKASGQSKVELRRYPSGEVAPHTHNVRFFTDHLTENRKVVTIYREEIETEYFTPDIGEGWRDAAVSLTATDVAPGGAKKTRFRISAFGQEARSWWRFYVVSAFGCCDQGDGHALYSLETGRLVMYASGERFEDSVVRIRGRDARAKDERDRWVAVTTTNNAFDVLAFGEHAREAALLLTYASETGPLQRVLVVEGGAERPLRGKSLEVKIPPGETGEPLVRVTLDSGATVELPVHADALDVAHARLPDGMTASILGAAKEAPVKGR